MKTSRKKRSGFTIIELMIVLVIVALLVALAYPSYVNYVRKARRGEAQQLLLNWSINQEIWRSNNTKYAPTTDPGDGTGFIPPPTHDDYDFSTAGAPTATMYTLQAAAKSGNSQEKDKARDGTPCSTLNLNSDGKKFSGGDTDILVCWD
jgi:type IV pilus assembly protein PilE